MNWLPSDVDDSSRHYAEVNCKTSSDTYPVKFSTDFMLCINLKASKTLDVFINHCVRRLANQHLTLKPAKIDTLPIVSIKEMLQPELINLKFLAPDYKIHMTVDHMEVEGFDLIAQVSFEIESLKKVLRTLLGNVNMHVDHRIVKNFKVGTFTVMNVVKRNNVNNIIVRNLEDTSAWSGTRRPMSAAADNNKRHLCLEMKFQLRNFCLVESTNKDYRFQYLLNFQAYVVFADARTFAALNNEREIIDQTVYKQMILSDLFVAEEELKEDDEMERQTGYDEYEESINGPSSEFKPKGVANKTMAEIKEVTQHNINRKMRQHNMSMNETEEIVLDEEEKRQIMMQRRQEYSRRSETGDMAPSSNNRERRPSTPDEVIDGAAAAAARQKLAEKKKEIEKMMAEVIEAENTLNESAPPGLDDSDEAAKYPSERKTEEEEAAQLYSSAVPKPQRTNRRSPLNESEFVTSVETPVKTDATNVTDVTKKLDFTNDDNITDEQMNKWIKQNHPHIHQQIQASSPVKDHENSFNMSRQMSIIPQRPHTQQPSQQKIQQQPQQQFQQQPQQQFQQQPQQQHQQFPPQLMPEQMQQYFNMMMMPAMGMRYPTPGMQPMMYYHPQQMSHSNPPVSSAGPGPGPLHPQHPGAHQASEGLFVPAAPGLAVNVGADGSPILPHISPQNTERQPGTGPGSMPIIEEHQDPLYDEVPDNNGNLGRNAASGDDVKSQDETILEAGPPAASESGTPGPGIVSPSTAAPERGSTALVSGAPTSMMQQAPISSVLHPATLTVTSQLGPRTIVTSGDVRPHMVSLPNSPQVQPFQRGQTPHK